MGTLKSMSRNIRRMSVRVVNLAGVTLEDRPIRLEDDPAEQQQGNAPASPVEMIPETSKESLRGRTLGVFGPTSGIRQAMLNMLLWRCVQIFKLSEGSWLTLWLALDGRNQ